MHHSKDIKLGKRNYCPIIISVLSIIVFTITLASFSVLPVSADTNTSVSPTASTINVNLSDGITIRVLDSTASTDLEDLVFDFTPTDNGVSSTKNAVVEVGTSNETGYTLYMQSDWREDNTSSTGRYKDNTSEAEFTTSLIHSGATSTPAIEDSIPTRLPFAISSGGTLADVLSSDYPFWYYYNTKDEESKVIPAYGNPDTLAEAKEAVEADRTTVPVTVGVDTSIVSGTYRNKLVFTATANPLIIDYAVSFDGNNDGAETTSTTGTVTEMPEGNLIASTTASQVSFTLPDEIPYNSGTKVFLGWSEEIDGLNEDGTAATLYQPGETYIDVADTSYGADNKTLYAIWGTPTFWNINYMQEMTTTLCASATKPLNTAGKTEEYLDTTGAHQGDTAYVAQRSLYDIRDLKKYTIRKLADGNCWMTENLAYELEAGKTYVGVNNTTGAEITFSTGSACAAQESCIINQNTRSSNEVRTGQWYYNWYAATAGSGTKTQTSGNAPYSICQKNWRLPPQTSSKSLVELSKAYSITNGSNNTTDNTAVWEATPLSFQRSGSLSQGEMALPEYGYYYTSTSSGYASNTGTYRAFDFYYYSGGTYVATNVHKENGLQVRCVAI